MFYDNGGRLICVGDIVAIRGFGTFDGNYVATGRYGQVLYLQDNSGEVLPHHIPRARMEVLTP